MFTGEANSTLQQDAGRQVKSAITWTRARVRSIPKHSSVSADCWFCRQLTIGLYYQHPHILSACLFLPFY